MVFSLLLLRNPLYLIILRFVESIFKKVKSLYRKAESYVLHHPTSKHQCTRLGSVPNLNSQASSAINERSSLYIIFEYEFKSHSQLYLLPYHEADLSL